MERFIAQVLIHIFSGLFGVFLVMTIFSFMVVRLEPMTLVLGMLCILSRMMRKYRD